MFTASYIPSVIHRQPPHRSTIEISYIATWCLLIAYFELHYWLALGVDAVQAVLLVTLYLQRRINK